MELKRILARDTRSATDKAIALYGPDVLVISNHQVDGQTELVVALDVQPEPVAVAPAPAPQVDFRRTFVQAQQFGAARIDDAAQADTPAQSQPEVQAAPAQTSLTGAPDPAPAPVAAVTAPAQQAALAESQVEVQARELQRSRELVDLVRGEIAALRREFRLSQQASAWQSGLQLHPSLTVLAQALNDAQVPMPLRALLMDALQEQNDPQQALAVWRSQLEHSLARPQHPVPTQGVHVLAGPSGSGKTLMCARLAQQASALHGTEGLALISYRDHRAGAWSQIQMLGSQLGMDCFRANDEESLRLLVAELSHRALVLIDTPGVQMVERLHEITRVAPQAGLHAVVSADASAAALRRVLVDGGIDWHSVMLSKLDESQAPWALLQLFSDNQLTLSCASGGSRITDLMSTFSLPQLIDLALAPMAAVLPTGAMAVAPAPVVKPLPGAAPAKTVKPRTRKACVPEASSAAAAPRATVKSKAARPTA